MPTKEIIDALSSPLGQSGAVGAIFIFLYQITNRLKSDESNDALRRTADERLLQSLEIVEKERDRLRAELDKSDIELDKIPLLYAEIQTLESFVLLIGEIVIRINTLNPGTVPDYLITHMRGMLPDRLKHAVPVVLPHPPEI